MSNRNQVFKAFKIWTHLFPKVFPSLTQHCVVPSLISIPAVSVCHKPLRKVFTSTIRFNGKHLWTAAFRSLHRWTVRFEFSLCLGLLRQPLQRCLACRLQVIVVLTPISACVHSVAGFPQRLLCIWQHSSFPSFLPVSLFQLLRFNPHRTMVPPPCFTVQTV